MKQDALEYRNSRLLEMLLSTPLGKVVPLDDEDFSAVMEMIKNGWVKKVVRGDPMFQAFFSDGPAFQFGGVVMEGVLAFVAGMENTRKSFEGVVDLELEEIIRRSHHSAPRHILAIQELARRKAEEEAAEAKEKSAAFEQTERHHREAQNEQKKQFRHSIRASWAGAGIAIVAAIAAIVSCRNSRQSIPLPPQVKPEPPADQITPIVQPLPSPPISTKDESAKPSEPPPAKEPLK